MTFKTQFEFLEKIKRWNFITNPLIKIINNIDEAEAHHAKIDQIRSFS